MTSRKIFWIYSSEKKNYVLWICSLKNTKPKKKRKRNLVNFGALSYPTKRVSYKISTSHFMNLLISTFSNFLFLLLRKWQKVGKWHGYSDIGYLKIKLCFNHLLHFKPVILKLYVQKKKLKKIILSIN